MTRRLVVGVTGASGSVLALETLRQLALADMETHLVVSGGAKASVAHELGSDGQAGALVGPREPRLCPHRPRRSDLQQLVPHRRHDRRPLLNAHAGSDRTRIRRQPAHQGRRCRAEGEAAAGRRAAEAPLHEGHLNSMLSLARMGAVVAPPVPPFYVKMETIEEMVRQIAARLVNWAGIDPGEHITRWGE